MDSAAVLNAETSLLPAQEVASAQEVAPRSLPRRIAGRANWQLVAILVVQAGFSVSLVSSNAAFTDEGFYLWYGHLEWAHWLHGDPLPLYSASSVPQIYPPLGALADSIGGLAGARILGMGFMLGATILVYVTSARLFGRRAAIFGSALWAFSEPALRAALAMYQPMACFLVALSACLAVQAAARPHRLRWVTASGGVLGFAVLTGFPFAIYAPVVVALAFFALTDTVDPRRAMWYTASMLPLAIALPAGIVTVLHLWPNVIENTVGVSRHGFGVTSVARGAWTWEGLIFGLACIAVTTTLFWERHWSRKLLMPTLACAGLLVPLYQAHIGSPINLDKHMLGGTWFLAVAAGYGAARMTAGVRLNPLAAVSATVALLAFPAINGLSEARAAFQEWPNVSALIPRLEPLLATTTRPILVSGRGDISSVLEYYTPQGHDWRRWTVDGSPHDFAAGRFGVVIIVLTAPLDSPQLARQAVSGDTRNVSTEILRLSTSNPYDPPNEFGIVTKVAESGNYRLQDVVPFTTSASDAATGVFAVWVRVR